MPDTRVQVYVYSSVDQSGVQDDPPFVACEWPAQSVVVNDVESRENAPAAFVSVYNAQKGTDLGEEDFRFFGPVWIAANVRQLDADTWEAVAFFDVPLRVTAASEQQVKEDLVAHLAVEYPKVEPNAFPRPLTEANVDWTYDPSGQPA